jgi:hypothetical protein
MLQALNDRLASFLDHSAIIHTIQPIDKEQRRAKSSGLKDLSEVIERLEIRPTSLTHLSCAWSDGKENRDGILGAALGPAPAQTMLRRSRGTPAPDHA